MDGLSESSISVSNYQFGINNPVSFNDPFGDKSNAPPDHIDNMKQLIDYLSRNGTSGFDDGIWFLEAGSGPGGSGFTTNSFYSPDATASWKDNKNGVSGIEIQYNYVVGDGKNFGFDKGAQLNTIVFGSIFISLSRFASDWNNWSDSHQNGTYEWFDGTHTYDRHDRTNGQLYANRKRGGAQVSQPGDRASYTAGLNKWERRYIVDQNYSLVTGGIAMAIVAPFAISATPSVVSWTSGIAGEVELNIYRI